MYTITWKEGELGKLYQVTQDGRDKHLPDSNFVYHDDLHPAFQQAVFMFKLSDGNGFECVSENAFRLTAEQFNGCWEDAQRIQLYDQLQAELNVNEPQCLNTGRKELCNSLPWNQSHCELCGKRGKPDSSNIS